MPTPSDEEPALETDVREGGYQGQVTVGRDLMTFEL